MNCVAVIDTDHYMSSNAQASFHAACARWEVDFVTLRDFGKIPVHMTFWKQLVLNHRLSGYDRVLIMDADMLIRDDAPSPFILYPNKQVVYAVGDRQSHYSPEILHTLELTVFQHWKHWFMRDGLMLKYDPPYSEFFNSGWWLCSPAYVKPALDDYERWVYEILMPIAAAKKGYPLTQGHCEQALWNFILWNVGIPVVLIPVTWNRISPPIEDPIMREFVYHFTGRPFGPEKRKAIQTYQWQYKLPAFLPLTSEASLPKTAAEA